MKLPTLNANDYTIVCPQCGVPIPTGRYVVCPHCYSAPDGLMDALTKAYHRRRDDYLRLIGLDGSKPITLNVELLDVLSPPNDPDGTVRIDRRGFVSLTIDGCTDPWDARSLLRDQVPSLASIHSDPIHLRFRANASPNPTSFSASSTKNIPDFPLLRDHVTEQWGEGFEDQPAFACECYGTVEALIGPLASASAQLDWLYEQHHMLTFRLALLPPEEEPFEFTSPHFELKKIISDHTRLLEKYTGLLRKQQQNTDPCLALIQDAIDLAKQNPPPFFSASRRLYQSKIANLEHRLQELLPPLDFLPDGIFIAEEGARLLQKGVPAYCDTTLPPDFPVFDAFDSDDSPSDTLRIMPPEQDSSGNNYFPDIMTLYGCPRTRINSSADIHRRTEVVSYDE